MLEKLENFNKIIAIQNCGSSGTLFIQSLLDNHPQILSLPALHGQQLLIFWEKHGELDKINLLQAFLENHQYWFDPESRYDEYGLLQMGLCMNEKVFVDRDQFTKYLLGLWSEFSILTRKDFIVSIYLAYNQTLGRLIDSSSWILYPIHSLPKKYALQLVKDFSKVYFLHMIREPIQNMGSTAKHINRYSHWENLYLLSCVISQMLHDIAIHAGNDQVFGMYPYVEDTADGSVQCRAIRLEDIHRDSKKFMLAICQWLNITWAASLLESSFDGKLWHNRRESIRQAGVGVDTIKQNHNEILNYFDKFRLKFISNFFDSAFQYQQKISFFKKIYLFFIFPLLFVPFRMELLMNRYQKQIDKLNKQHHPGFRKEWGWFGKKIAFFLPPSKSINVITIIFYNIQEYINCRQLLFLAWKKSLFNKHFEFVKLLIC